jgi:hypothetical protein
MSLNFIYPIGSEYYYIPLCSYIFSTSFSYIWDITMDWGLLRCWEKGKWGLRNMILYPPYFYYFSTVTNLILRFFFLFNLPGPSFYVTTTLGGIQGQLFILAIMEAY